MRVTYTVTEQWESGFSAELVVKNDASWAIGDWRVAFDFAPRIGNVWNARVISHVGTTYVLGPVEANWDDGELAPGEAVAIGFVATGAPAEQPANASLNGAPVRIGALSAAPRPTPAAIVAAPPWPERAYAPYVDATAWPPLDLASAATELGVRHFRLGFVVAKSAADAVPTWGGVHGATAGYRLREINAVRTQGGDVALTFGGATGVELAMAARSALELATAYKAVVDAYGARSLDFDIEGAALADRAAVQRRSEALAILQSWLGRESRAADVWLTLPVAPTGLTPDGVRVVAAALAHRVELRGINVMAMDYGPAAAPDPAGRMGSYAIAALRAVHGQLGALYADAGSAKTAAELWQSLGVTPMIGRNDVPGEIFTADDARAVVAFAAEAGVGSLSSWSLNRDRPCEAAAAIVSPTCSGIAQTANEFARIFRAFP